MWLRSTYINSKTEMEVVGEITKCEETAKALTFPPKNLCCYQKDHLLLHQTTYYGHCRRGYQHFYH